VAESDEGFSVAAEGNLASARSLLLAFVFPSIKKMLCDMAEAPLGACYRPVSGRHEAAGVYYLLIHENSIRRIGNEDLEIRLSGSRHRP
jgi:hypothetical protein